MVLIALAAVAAVVLLLLRTRGRGPDLPERLVAAATTRLPAQRSVWGQALVAELAAVQGRGRRWRFAAGVLRIALFPPVPQPTTALATAAVGTAATVVATAAAVRLLPTASVFVAALGLLTSGYATAVACRRPRLPTGRAQLAVGAVATIGLLAAVGAVIATAVAHPAATQDRTHVFSVLFAATLSGYLIAGVSAIGARKAQRPVLWGGIAGGGAIVAASTVLRSAGPVVTPISPIAAAATVATAVLVAVVTRSRGAGARAGLLTAVLSAPIHFALTLVALQHAHPSALTDAYDVAAFPRSGYPDVASYVLSDALAGGIVSLAITLLAMSVLAAAGAAVAQRIRPA